jgi:hypothetical protein
MKRWVVAAALVMTGTLPLAGAKGAATTFRVRVENISAADTLRTSQGNVPAAVAPVLWLVHSAKAPIFTPGTRDRGIGLEALAEDGNPALLGKAAVSMSGVFKSGVVTTPAGATAPGPILPGQAFDFTVTAMPGMKLTLAMMFGQSNDLFYAPASGVALFDGSGQAITGDITSSFALWDAGTEVNQEPGVGADQAPRQKAPNTGTSERAPVRLVAESGDGFTYPAVAAVLKVSITPEPATLTRR